MPAHSGALFHDGDLHGVLEGHLAQASVRVDALEKNQFLNAADDAIIESLADSLHVNSLEVDRQAMTQEMVETTVSRNDDFHRGRRISVPGFRIVVDLPFTGDTLLWKLQPSSFQSMWPRADILSGEQDGIVRLTLEVPADTAAEQIKQHIEQQLRLIEFYVNAQRSQVDACNSQLPGKLRQAIASRRQRLQAQNNLAAVLGIPLKRSKYDVEVSPVQMKRRIVRPLPAAPARGFVPEPGISDADYQHILKVIRHEGRTFEGAATTFAKLEEEELRDILLAHLNGHYEGDATGETFRKKGKTDIRIEDENRAAFVGECKIWGGDKKLTEAIDQLLGYLTWRDCKAAVIVFNKSVAGFGDILARIPDLLRGHALVRGAVGLVEPGEWQARFVSKADESREVVVHLFFFNLFSGEPATSKKT